MRCPTCNSPDPARHPAMQFEGEVQICRDEYHRPLRPLIQRGDETLARELLQQALGELDSIAAEPAPYEDDEKLVRLYRQMAGKTARNIRERLRAATV